MSSQQTPVVLEDAGKGSERGPTWNGVAAGERQMSGSPLTSFLGGSPLSVLVRLLFVSLIVGALLTWIGVSPWDIVHNARNIAIKLWNMGFGAFREVTEYVIAGAIVVIPIWLVLRLMNSRSSR